MAKSIKLQNENYWDSTSVVHNQELLSNVLSGSFTSPSTDLNGWGKFEFLSYIIYFKYVAMLASFAANAWAQLDLGDNGYFPPGVAYNPNTMIFLGTPLALDSAIDFNVGIRNTGDTGITCTYRNKYTGAIPNSPIRFHFMLIVKK